MEELVQAIAQLRELSSEELDLVLRFRSCEPAYQAYVLAFARAAVEACRTPIPKTGVLLKFRHK